MDWNSAVKLYSPAPPPRSSDLTPKTLAKIQACRPCIEKLTVSVDRFLLPFWAHVGSALGTVLLHPFGRPDRPKIRPRCNFKPHLLQKRDVHETLYKTLNVGDVSAQDGPERGPKVAQDGPKTINVS